MILRKFKIDSKDAQFIYELLNQPSFIQFIGDRGIKTLEDAKTYISTKCIESYQKNGFGLYGVELKSSPDQTLIGMCGLVTRPELNEVEVGFAFLPQFWKQGYALEAARATVEYAQKKLNLKRITGITLPENKSSIKVLEKLGLKFQKKISILKDKPENLFFVLEI